MPGSSGTSVSSAVTAAAMSLVAGGGLVGVGDADDLAELHRELDGLAGAGQSLLRRRVEQRRAGAVVEDEVELPGQVGRVAHAGAQALPGERGHLVGGVTGDEHPSGAPLLGVAGLERVDGVAFEAGVVGV